MRSILFGLVACGLFAAPAVAWELRELVAPTGYRADLDLGPAWAAHGGEVQLELNLDLIRDLGLSVQGVDSELDARGLVRWRIQPTTAVEFHVRGGVSVERLLDGRWVVDGGLRFGHGPGLIDLSRLVLTPSRHAPHVFEIRDAAGELLLFVDHMHAEVDPEAARITLKNMDLRLAPRMAARIGEPRHAGLAIGLMRIDASVHIPAGARLGPEPDTPEALSCSGRPVWPGTPGTVADVRLIALSQVQQMRRNAASGEVVIAPSATLKNRGGADAADIPWWRQFTGPHPPYGNDQHPYLVWGLYRIHEGRIRQIGRSGVKHAFLTVNTNCDINCSNGNILWPGCEDVYGVGNNDSPTHMGPIDEIQAFHGIWNNCGSFFDPNCTGSQTQQSSGGYLHRMVVREAEMSSANFPGAQYLFQGWYVVRDDVNIWNTMGVRSVNPVFSGSSWSFTPLGAFAQGPAVEAWIAQGQPAPGQSNTRIVTDHGHASLLVNVIDLGHGRWRYEYALANHDLDVGIDRLEVPVPESSLIEDLGFARAENTGSGQWAAQRQAGLLSWTAATAAARQPWASLFNFWFVADAPPVIGEARIRIVAGQGGTLVSAATLVPWDERIFGDGFEQR